jgi:hypothetical protein
MTFLELQDRIMDRLNLSSDEARERIKDFINERYRNLQTSCGLSRVRKGTIVMSTVNAQADYTPIVDDDDDTLIIIKPLGLKIGTGVNFPPLTEITIDALRRSPSADPARPHSYIVTNYTADGCTIKLWPTPGRHLRNHHRRTAPRNGTVRRR